MITKQRRKLLIALEASALSICMVASAFAQDAKIMIVDKSDTYELKQAYSAYKDAQKHWDES